MSNTEILSIMANSECLFNERQIAAALDTMAAEISAQLADSNPVLLCVMNGGIVLTGHLAPRLNFPLQIDYIHATRYREQLTGSELHWRVTPAAVLKGRVVLVVDDIFDEGETLAAIRRWCLEQGAAACFSAVLVDKQHDRKRAEIRCADFTALYIPDRYVFGYGMDYKGYWRNAPGIFAVTG
jgi:hypoxanthine phosphoribosyltransferase